MGDLVITKGQPGDSSTGHDLSVTGFDPSQTLSQSNPLPGQNYYDPQIDKSLIPAQQGRTAETYGQQFNYGINPDKGEISGFQGLPGSNSDPMVQAINNQAERQTAGALRGITTQNQQAGTMAAAHEQNIVGEEAGAEYHNQVQNFNQQYQYQMARYDLVSKYNTAKAGAQSALWGTVFGGLGKVIGAGAASK